jgi:hypothetical protein
MTAATTNRARARAAKPAKKLSVDAEARTLMANPVFRAMLDEARASVAMGATIPLDELDRRLGPMTDDERASAEAYLDALDGLAAEQSSDVTDDQGRLLKLVLVAADYARGRGALNQLAEDSGCAEADIRVVAAALRAAHLTEAPPVRA